MLVSVPLRGVGCFYCKAHVIDYENGFPSPCGVGVVSFWIPYLVNMILGFPSPCGVWVVSAKLHILFGAAGKRIVNSAVLLYHIGRWFINSKLRNYKVPCEAHKTET